jgi:hypothetical protein
MHDGQNIERLPSAFTPSISNNWKQHRFCQCHNKSPSKCVMSNQILIWIKSEYELMWCETPFYIHRTTFSCFSSRHDSSTLVIYINYLFLHTRYLHQLPIPPHSLSTSITYSSTLVIYINYLFLHTRYLHQLPIPPHSLSTSITYSFIISLTKIHEIFDLRVIKNKFGFQWNYPNLEIFYCDRQWPTNFNQFLSLLSLDQPLDTP